METQFANIFTDRLNVPVVSPCCPFNPTVYTRFGFDVFQTIEPFSIDA